MNKEELSEYIMQMPTRIKVGNYHPLLKDMVELIREDSRGVMPFEDEGNKNLLSYDTYNNSFLLEMFEFVDGDGKNMYSVFDGFKDIETALKYTYILSTNNQNRIRDKWLDEREQHLTK